VQKFGAILDNYKVQSQIYLERIKTSKNGQCSDQELSLPHLRKQFAEHSCGGGL